MPAACQRVGDYKPVGAAQVYSHQADGTRYMRLRGHAGPLNVRYEGVVDLVHIEAEPDDLEEVEVGDLPLDVISYIYPSRYCQSDRMRELANKEFGNMVPGYARVLAIKDWVNQRTRFTSGSSAESTSAIDTLADQAGVCRDFTHLMITLCRALNIPARFVSGIDYGSDPALGPPDFHAYVEVYLSGRWYLFDPSGLCPTMGLMRLGTGRDAADVSFATVFGSVTSSTVRIAIDAIVDSEEDLRLPAHQTKVLSTADIPVTHYHLIPH
ncbi:transglutaminase-like domain-containing protein [Nitrincola sp. A-D6]|uniref:transglutaminase-like domain-containing protein n=1 Tax=Nitrincola sp. A-D6 TaxID=1545442 RepID=UPI000A61FBAE|nr:transglutaminase family protein [Nitrincola sp. A-D6]